METSYRGVLECSSDVWRMVGPVILRETLRNLAGVDRGVGASAENKRVSWMENVPMMIFNS